MRIRTPSFILWIAIAALAIGLVTPAAAQGSIPPQVDRAIALLGQVYGRTFTLADFDRYGFSQAFFPDSSLGCALYATPTTFAQPVSAYTIELVYQGIRYEYRVREDLSDAFPCDAALLALTPGAPIVSATPDAVNNCPVGFAGYLRPRLVAGGQGSIGADGVPNRLRARPSRSAEQIGQIEPGTTFDILDGPSCEAETLIVWWRVNAGGVVGWTAEGVGTDYFIDPVAGGPLTLPTERFSISSISAPSLTVLSEVAFTGGRALSFSRDNKVVIGGAAGLLIYDLNTNEQLDIPLSIATDAQQVAFSPDGRYIAFADSADTLYIIDTQTGTTITPADAPDTDITSLAFSVNNLLAIGGGDVFGNPDVASLWAIYDIPNQRQLAVTPTPRAVRDVAFSPDGLVFSWVDGSNLLAITVADGAPLITQSIASAAPAGLAWRPIVQTGDVNQVAYADGNQVRTLTLGGATGAVGDAPAFFPGVIDYSPDGLLLAAMNLVSAVDGSNEPPPSVLTLFDMNTGLPVFGTGYELGMDLAFSPDGTVLVLVTDTSVFFVGVEPETFAVG